MPIPPSDQPNLPLSRYVWASLDMLDHTLPAIAVLHSYHSLLLSQCKESKTLFPSRFTDDLIRQEHILLYNLKLFVLQVVGMEPGPA